MGKRGKRKALSSRLERLRSLVENVDWESQTERLELIRRLDDLFRKWSNCRPPNLGEFFRKERMERLLLDALSLSVDSGTRLRFVAFVAETGYKYRSDLDANRRPVSLQHTTPIHLAAENWFCRRDRVVRKLFDIYHRYDANYVDEVSERTHLHVACMLGLDDVVRNFIELGRIDVNDCIWPPKGDAPLHLALESGNKKLAALLLRRGADPNFANTAGLTPLHIICLGKDDHHLAGIFFKINVELNQRVRIDARDADGDSPLNFAVFNGHKRLTELLLRKGADPNSANTDRLTPLHIICKGEHDDVDLAKLFFEINGKMKVEVNAKDKLGRTSLQWAVANRLPGVVDVLLDRGADLKNFIFPAESYFCKGCRPCDPSSKFMQAANALLVVERLEKRGYALDLGDALTIMKMFLEWNLLENSADNNGERWHDDEGFAREAKTMMIISNLSLYDLIQLRLDEAKKRLSLMEYHEFAHTMDWDRLPERLRDACVRHLCEKLSRRFFRQWALESYLILTHIQLPILCYEMMMNHLMNQDLLNICLGACLSQSSR